ncbi:MAG: complex I NDUFA9 subunit family protein [Gammaproteobacteria bacterium]|nr:complex I NDUFA9 subunit family protein [Gammaproteobacteria bacterium]NIR98612.1 complex I NDUFA9 subunit family protein [Gammaproteobacteria bacterium]NIT64335.1 complex I NDUFA9 subunit family protein [Gammaproteobacteria bacterium]NIV21259.1 NAD-dependent epimerase/dehydratase family protein [Gammaproteobacteria bacterium]NIX10963.1 NAD-dependent epimerase/dehydratase family protein [Gammaproteobacteria bacterium]
MRHSTICVLGGTGFVGKHLVALLSDRGYSIRIPSRRRERHRDLLVLPTVEVVEANVHDPAVLRQQVAGCDAVINLVGILNEKGSDGSGFRRVHVELARKVVEACRNTGVRRLLHMSALGADAHEGPSHYLYTKGEAEDLVHAAAGEDLHVTSFRPSVIFGPGDSFFNRFAALLRLSPWFFPLACPDSRFAPVYVGDVVEAYRRALEEREAHGRRYDLCGPRTYTLKELVEYTAECIGRHRTVIGLNDRLSYLQARVLEWVPGKPMSRDNYLSLQMDNVCPAGSALEELGITPTSIEAVVPQYLAHRSHRDHYMDYRRRARRG